MEEYKSKAITTEIKALSKMTIKVNDNYYSVEMEEKREIPKNTNEQDLEKERKLIFDDINTEVDNQIQQILETLKK